MTGLPAPGSSPSRGIARILHNTGWLLGSKGFGAVLSLVYLAIVTRSLGIDGFGRFALILGLGQTAAAFVNFQSWQIIIRYAADPWLSGARPAVARIIGFAFAVDIASALFGLVLIVLAVPLLASMFGWDPTTQMWTIVFAAALLLAIRSTPIGILRLQDRFAAAAFADALVPLTRFIGALAVFALGPTVTGFLIAWAMSELVSAAGYWVLALQRRHGLGIDVLAPPRLVEVRSAAPGIVGFALLSNGNGSLNLASRQLAVLIVGAFAGPAGAGAYRLAQQFAQALAQLTQMLARAIFPELMRNRSGIDQDTGFADLINRAIRLSLIVGAGVGLLVLVAGRPIILAIAGREFLAAWPIFLWLGMAAAIDLAGVVFEPALFAAGGERRVFMLRLIAVAVLVIAMLVLLPVMGPAGGGVAVLLGSLSAFVLLGVALRHSLKPAR